MQNTWSRTYTLHNFHIFIWIEIRECTQIWKFVILVSQPLLYTYVRYCNTLLHINWIFSPWILNSLLVDFCNASMFTQYLPVRVCQESKEISHCCGFCSPCHQICSAPSQIHIGRHIWLTTRRAAKQIKKKKRKSS